MKQITLDKALESHKQFKIESSKFESFKVELSKFTAILKKDLADGVRENKYTIDLSDFLKATFYKDDYEVKPYKDTDLAIFKDNKPLVLFELKTPTNTSEMVTDSDFNRKALHEMIWYYLDSTREVIDGKIKKVQDPSIRNLVITNFVKFYALKPAVLERVLSANGGFVINVWLKYKNGQALTNKKEDFYDEIKNFYQSSTVLDKLEFVVFDYHDLNKTISGKKNLFRFFSIYYLLAEISQRSYVKHTLKRAFYDELLYIMGLKESKENNSVLIKIDKERADFIAPQIYKICIEDKEKSEEESIEIAFELSIIWINRLLFLKLFEGQLFKSNGVTDDYRILSNHKISSFSDLNSLFFDVLGKRVENRPNEPFFLKFTKIPYLNSALFEKEQVEKEITLIKQLDNREVKLFNKSIIKNTEKLPLLRYIFDFLDNWNFASSVNETEDEEEQNKIIDAAVLGLIFEKINGYKDGSFYTPSEITEFIAKQSVENIVLSKFNLKFGLTIKSFKELRDYIVDYDKRKDANELINSLRFCDPAVGSGHFLVSLLNRILSIKSYLGCLFYFDSEDRLKSHKIDIVNDEILVTDGQNSIFSYDKDDIESQRIQKTLFNEKRIIIENCLFGVDLNPNAVTICRLRLWIELLKNAYYENNVMETLPNIDININVGDSLISANLVKNSKQISNAAFNKKDRELLQELKDLVGPYKHEKDKAKKHEIKEKIRVLSNHFVELLSPTNSSDTYDLLLGEIKTGTKQDNIGVQWLVAFPDLITEDGYFEGFDCVIGNPPFIQIQKFDKSYKKMLQKLDFVTYEGSSDVYCMFIELGCYLLKDNGTLCFITSNKWLRSSYGEKTRNFLLNGMNPELLIDLGPGIFENATVDSSIIFLKKEKYNHSVLCCKASKEDISNLSTFVSSNSIQQDFNIDDNWVILSPIEISIKNKLETNGVPLLNWENVKINRGILTGCNEAFIVTNEQRNEILDGCLDSDERARTEQIIRPVLRGEHIKRESITWTDTYLICFHNGYTKNDGSKVNKLLIEDYPSIKKWLDQYYSRLESRDDKGDTPYNLRSCTYMDDFNHEKIVFPAIMTKGPFFAHDSEGRIALAPGNYLIIENSQAVLEYLINFGYFALRTFYMGGGIEGELKVNRLQKLPVPQGTSNNLVDKLGLTDEEKAFVENFNKQFSADKSK